MASFSHSRLGTYENCPRQYKLQYIDKPEVTKLQGIEAFLGSMVHEALEKLYKDQQRGKLDTLDEILAYYKTEWQKKIAAENIQIVNKEFKAEDYCNSGIKQLTDYYDRYKPFDQTKTLGTEIMFSMALDKEGKYRLTGVIDRLSHDGKGVFEIHDYKTNRQPMTQKEADESRQLAVYQLYVEENYPQAKEIKLIYHFTMHDLEVVTKRTRKQLDDLRDEIMKLIHVIEADEEFKPIETELCKWCNYTEYCPAKKHGIKLDRLPKNEYMKEPGLKLVEKYSQLYEKICEEKSELEKMGLALIEYAKKEDISVITGSEHRVKVTIEDKPHLPNKDEKGRAELEEVIRAAGKWDEVSDISNPAILREYTGWGDKLIAKIKQFIMKVHRESVGKPTEIKGTEEE